MKIISISVCILHIEVGHIYGVSVYFDAEETYGFSIGLLSYQLYREVRFQAIDDQLTGGSGITGDDKDDLFYAFQAAFFTEFIGVARDGVVEVCVSSFMAVIVDGIAIGIQV